MSDERLIDLASVFVGPDVALFASHYISKPPFSGQPVLWHQDGAYWPLEPMQVVTLWLSVDESTPENGCMRVIPGSHRGKLYGVRKNTEVQSVLGSESDVEVDESDAVDLILSPGDVEVHHPGIMHGSNANTSPRRRCGLTIRYIPTSTRIVSDESPYPSAFHLRGKPGVNEYQPKPQLRRRPRLPLRRLRRLRLSTLRETGASSKSSQRGSRLVRRPRTLALRISPRLAAPTTGRCHTRPKRLLSASARSGWANIASAMARR